MEVEVPIFLSNNILPPLTAPARSNWLRHSHHCQTIHFVLMNIEGLVYMAKRVYQFLRAEVKDQSKCSIAGVVMSISLTNGPLSLRRISRLKYVVNPLDLSIVTLL